MLERLFDRLEQKSFGVRDFRKHVHRIDGTTVNEAGHSHRVGFVTGPPWPSPRGHVHRVVGATASGKASHSHEVSGWTSPSTSTDANHTHTVSLRTKNAESHVHRINGVTASFIPSRTAAYRTEAQDGVFPE